MFGSRKKKEVGCPATGFAKSCEAVREKCACPKFITLSGGRNPQTGERVEPQSGCSDSFLPLLLMEISQVTRQAGAATESFRNEVVKAEDRKLEALAPFLGGRKHVTHG